MPPTGHPLNTTGGSLKQRWEIFGSRFRRTSRLETKGGTKAASVCMCVCERERERETQRERDRE